jgi:hypothetical protein
MKYSPLKSLFVLLALPLFAQAGNPSPIQTASSKNPKMPQEAAIIPEDHSLGWSLGAGVQWRQIGEVSFRGATLRGPRHLPSAPSGSSGSIGYSDGFVRRDSSGGGQTWNWGYESASQIRGNGLTFNGSSSQLTSRTITSRPNLDQSDEASGLGFYIRLDSPEVLNWRHLTLSAGLGYSFAQDKVGRSGIAYRAERQTFLRSQTVRDVYDISAITPLPDAPYNGTFSGPGPVISISPTRREGGGSRERLLDSEVFTSQLDQNLQLQLHTFSLGPRAGFEFGRLTTQCGIGLAVNIVPWDFTSRETLRSNRRGKLKSWPQSESGIDILPGVYAELATQYRLSKRWSVNTGIRYDWSQNLEGEAAGTVFEVDLGGWTATLGLSLSL